MNKEDIDLLQYHLQRYFVDKNLYSKNVIEDVVISYVRDNIDFDVVCNNGVLTVQYDCDKVKQCLTYVEQLIKTETEKHNDTMGQ
jgi:hypothetical protein